MILEQNGIDRERVRPANVLVGQGSQTRAVPAQDIPSRGMHRNRTIDVVGQVTAPRHVAAGGYNNAVARHPRAHRWSNTAESGSAENASGGHLATSPRVRQQPQVTSHQSNRTRRISDSAVAEVMSRRVMQTSTMRTQNNLHSGTQTGACVTRVNIHGSQQSNMQ